MEDEQIDQSRQEPAEEPARNQVRQKVNLEWIESEWFKVWLKLARREHDAPS